MRRRFALLSWSGYFRDRHATARLTDAQTAAIRWLAAQPGGPAQVLVISEDWSSDCRRDVPYLARLAEAGGLELSIFIRDGDRMLRQGLPDPAAGGNADLVREYANEKNGQRGRGIAALLDSPFPDVWAHAGVAEIVSALHERLVTAARS